MKFTEVRLQLEQIFTRAIETGISVKQNFPAINEDALLTIGSLKSTTIALKNTPYKDIYNELESNDQYHIKLPDGGLLLFQYTFENQDTLLKHRLGYFPSPSLPSIEEAPELYERDDLYGDILLHRIVRFPIRFDFDPKNYKRAIHPHSHVTLGQFDNCRIPVSHPSSPNTFFMFIVRNFYFLLYKKNMNSLEKKITKCNIEQCITAHETPIPHLKI